MTTKDLILKKLDLAPESLLNEILRLLETHTLQTKQPIGIPGRDLLPFVGLIPRSDLTEIATAIEEHRTIDPNDW